jgi:hypothetical protein
MKVREHFPEVKEKVSLLKPYLELMVFSPGWALKIAEFEKLLCCKPEAIYKSSEEVYGISARYRVDDELTSGIIAHEFAEIVARELNIVEHELIDKICVERGFGEDLLYALQNDVLPGMVERDFIVREDLENRIHHLKKLLYDQ